MIITGYFDESGTHSSAEVAVMAGYVADARRWRKFEKRAAKLFRRFHVDIYHTIDIRRTDKDFSGWSVDRKIVFIDEFHHIINETLERGFASILRAEDYAYYSGLYWPKRARKDSQYGLLFRSTMAAVLESATEIPHWRREDERRLNVVLEVGHRNAADAVRIYNFVKSRHSGDHRAFSGLTFVSKEDCLPMAAADLFAYTAYGIEVGSKPIGQSKVPIKADASYPGHMYRRVFNRGLLDSLYQQAIDLARRSDS